jgi:nickel transport protein
MNSTIIVEDQSMFRVFLLLFVLLLFSVQQASAHDAWFVQKDGGLTLAYGHGKKLDPYDPTKVKDAKGYDSKGQAVAVQIVNGKESVSIPLEDKPAIVTALFDGGYGVKTTDGWQKLTKREAQGKYSIVEALKSRKYSKALLRPCEVPAKPVGLDFEIVPDKDPFSVKPGDSLPLRVFLNGKPLEGAVIKTGDSGHSASQSEIKTDKEGKTSVVIAKPGLQLIVASHKIPLKDDPDADTLSLSSSLTFDVH